MAAGPPNTKLPPSLAYPFIVVSAILFLTAMISLGHWFDGMFMTIIGMIVGMCEIVLGIRLFVWLNRNKAALPRNDDLR
jgi:NADH:ubiquinone oxidoreductase subunit K